MAHSKKQYKFKSQEEAQDFADTMNANRRSDPSADVYVRGPVYMDFVEGQENYWQVEVECYW